MNNLIYFCTIKKMKLCRTAPFSRIKAQLTWALMVYFKPARKIRRISFLYTDSYNYYTLHNCFFYFLFMAPSTIYLSSYGINGADSKRFILVSCPKQTDCTFPAQLMSIDDFTVFPRYWLGLAQNVLDLWADPSSVYL